jgi:hypothetical protein
MLKIGNVLKAVDDGRWIKAPATSGDFALKIKPLLPGEQYALNEQCEAIKKDPKVTDKESAIAKLRRDAAISKIVDWRDLADAEGGQIPFSAELLQDEKFIDALSGCTMVGGRYFMNWLISKINKSDAFTEEEDNSFLGSI